MKIIAIERDLSHQLMTPPAVTLIADSAVVLPGKPLFVPAFSTQWEARLYLAFRISRLGKSVSQRFAYRYRDAVTLALRIVPLDTMAALKAAGHDCGILGLFDNAIELGTWQPLGDDNNQQFKVECSTMSAVVTLADSMIDAAIAELSSYATMKMGDVIMPLRFPVAMPAEPDTAVKATLNGIDVLNVRFK